MVRPFMAEIVDIPVVDLLLDSTNPRLSTEQPDQQRTLLELIKGREDHILNLAEDIVNEGVDPTTLVVVVPTGDRRKRYKVIEGNRRVLALKALETPSLVSAALTTRQSKRLNDLSRKFAQKPIDILTCVLFAREEDAEHWVWLRHTGQNDGRGLLGWAATEQDRYRARRHGVRKPAGQILEFVEKHGHLSPEAQASSRGILTNIERLLSTPDARRALGVDIANGQVVALHPMEAVAKSLSRVVEDAKTGAVTVPDLYHRDHRVDYVKGLPRTVLPKKSTLLASPVLLDDLTEGKAQPRTSGKSKAQPKRSKTQSTAARTTIVPDSATLNVAPPRINAVYNELSQLTAETFPNACSVLLRVFLELSVDHYIDDNNLMPEAAARNAPLAKRLKLVAGELHKKGKIPAKLKKAVEQVADGPSPVAPGIPTFNQYVHNSYSFPKARELYAAWDELAPLLGAMWR
jgi:hypothetical protein